MNSKSIACTPWVTMIGAVWLCTGILLGCSQEEGSQPEPTATVAEQPPPSQAQPNADQEAQTSLGDEQIAVPKVLGLSLGDAAAELQSAKLQFNANFKPTAEVPEGQIVKQDPDAGVMTTEGTVVGLVVAAVPPEPVATAATVRMPAVLGKQLTAASASLRSAKLLVKTTRKAMSGVAAGLVVGQSPNAGDLVKENTTAWLVVAAAPTVRRVVTATPTVRRAVTATPTVRRAVTTTPAFRQAVTGKQIDEQADTTPQTAP